MKISNINANTSVSSIYSSIYQGSMALNNFKLNRSLFSSNNALGISQLGQDAMQYVKDIKSASKDLSSSLKDLSGSAFSKQTAVSSDSNIMTAGYTGNRPSGIKETSVKIDQTAAGQVNEGSRLSADAAFGESGASKFSVDIGGKTTEFSINVAAGDTNSSVQKKMADAINNAGIGVKASVETDSAGGVSMLKLEATSTGDNDKSKFTVTDITGSLAAKTGANEISSEAKNAIYSVNGGPSRTSQSNSVDLGNGLSATFKKASDKAVTISAGKDMGRAKDAVEGMVNSYNSLFGAAAQMTDDPKAQNLASKMVNISKTYSSSLSSIGIGFDNDGRMTLDKSKVDAAADNGSLERFFTQNSGKNYGFTNQLSRLSDNVSKNTSNYVSRSAFGNNLTENFAYTGLGDLLQYSIQSSGWIFDYSS